jgi:hypothetical protein
VDGVSSYDYRIKDSQIRLVSDALEDFDLPKPTPEQLAEYKADVAARTPKLSGFTTKLVPDHRLEALINGRAVLMFPLDGAA